MMIRESFYFLSNIHVENIVFTIESSVPVPLESYIRVKESPGVEMVGGWTPVIINV